MTIYTSYDIEIRFWRGIEDDVEVKVVSKRSTEQDRRKIRLSICRWTREGRGFMRWRSQRVMRCQSHFNTHP